MNIPKISFKKFKKNWENVIQPATPKYIGKGESLMNYLSIIWEEEYIRISSVHYYTETNIDCFFNDELIPNTLTHLKKVWK